MKTRIPLVLAIAVLSISGFDAEARKVRQSIPIGKTAKVLRTDSAAISTRRIEVATDSLRVLGQIVPSRYDKPADTTREALFITNESPYLLSEITLEIEYLIGAEAVHSRQVTVSCDVPPGATRRLDFRSWDTQKSFRYVGSRETKRRFSTPYDVSVKVTGGVFQIPAVDYPTGQ